MSGVKIGNGAIVAAGSIVTKDVQAYSVVAGIPARFIKLRFPVDIIDLLEESNWWMKHPLDLSPLFLKFLRNLDVFSFLDGVKSTKHEFPLKYNKLII